MDVAAAKDNAQVEAEEFARRIEAQSESLRLQLPTLDPGDLQLILETLARPVGSGRRFFLRELRPGVYVL